MWRSPVLFGPPSIGASGGIGYGPGSLSSAYSKLTGTRCCDPGTTTNGIPIGPPSQVPEPKSAFRPVLDPMLLIQEAEREWTGKESTRAFQTLSAGSIGQPASAGAAAGATAGAATNGPASCGEPLSPSARAPIASKPRDFECTGDRTATTSLEVAIGGSPLAVWPPKPAHPTV